jgi:esterase
MHATTSFVRHRTVALVANVRRGTTTTVCAGNKRTTAIVSHRWFTSTAAVASSSSSPVSAVDLHSLDFPYLKSDPALSGHDHSRGTSVADAPLVILHGLLGSAGNWRTTAPKLSSHRRILSLDVRNHGASPHVEDMRFAECAADVIRLLDQKGIDKAVVMGHSLGGKIAMASGLLYPDRLVSVISVDMAPQDYNLGDDGWTGVSKIVEACALVPVEQMHSRSEVDTFLKPHIPDFTTRAFVLQNVVVHTSTDANGERHQTVGWRCNLPTLHRSLPLIAGFDLQAPVQPYTQPSLFIGGGKSPYLTEKQRPQVKKLFPASEWVTIPDAGHWVHVEKTKEFIEVVRAFLKKLEHHH